MDISAFGFVAEFFKSEEIQTRLIEAFRKNNIEFTGKKDEDLDDDGIKDNVAEFPPELDMPIFLLWLAFWDPPTWYISGEWK